MDRFNLLSDELLIKILSFVPTKVAVSTSVLSKRWEHLWMWLPKLEFGRIDSSSSECKMLQCFLDRKLSLHRAPVIESLHLQLNSSHFTPDSIKLWIGVAISHSVRSLEVNYYFPAGPDILPMNLYTCKSLVILKLCGHILLDVPRMVFLPSLKTLHIDGMRYFDEECLPRLLSNCPILEDLLLELRDDEIMGELTVVSQSLQRLSLDILYHCDIGSEIVIKTPSLKYFKLVDRYEGYHDWLIENMPNLTEAYVDVRLPNINSLIGSLTSVNHLTICSDAKYDEGFVFNQLRRLQICICHEHLSDLLVRLLKDSPHLQVLDIFQMDDHNHNEIVDWKQPTTVPECLLSSLQIFNWKRYTGEPGEKDVAVYILKNASHLRTATIKSDELEVPTYEMLRELALTSRASTTCQLVFESFYDTFLRKYRR